MSGQNPPTPEPSRQETCRWVVIYSSGSRIGQEGPCGYPLPCWRHPAPVPDTEIGRRLASEREDLIAAGIDPAELLIPRAPVPDTTTGETCGVQYGVELLVPHVNAGETIWFPSRWYAEASKPGDCGRVVTRPAPAADVAGHRERCDHLAGVCLVAPTPAADDPDDGRNDEHLHGEGMEAPAADVAGDVEGLAEDLVMLVFAEWHDLTCPEGPECRSRSLHMASAVGVGSILTGIADKVIAAGWKGPTEVAALIRAASEKELREAYDYGHGDGLHHRGYDADQAVQQILSDRASDERGK